MESLRNIILNTLKNAKAPLNRAQIHGLNQAYFSKVPAPKALNNISKELHLMAEEGLVENEILRPTGIVAWKLKMPADQDVAEKEAETVEIDRAMAAAHEHPTIGFDGGGRVLEVVQELPNPTDPERLDKLATLDLHLDALARTISQPPVEIPPIRDLDLKLRVLDRLSPMLAGDIGDVLDSIRRDLGIFNSLRA